MYFLARLGILYGYNLMLLTVLISFLHACPMQQTFAFVCHAARRVFHLTVNTFESVMD